MNLFVADCLDHWPVLQTALYPLWMETGERWLITMSSSVRIGWAQVEEQESSGILLMVDKLMNLVRCSFLLGRSNTSNDFDLIAYLRWFAACLPVLLLVCLLVGCLAVLSPVCRFSVCLPVLSLGCWLSSCLPFVLVFGFAGCPAVFSLVSHTGCLTFHLSFPFQATYLACAVLGRFYRMRFLLRCLGPDCTQFGLHGCFQIIKFLCLNLGFEILYLV